jgi:ABC-2 type transport system permease protein
MNIPDNRPRWIGFQTLVRRECTVIVRFWSVTLAPPAVMTVLYFAVFGQIMRQRIGEVGGVDYGHYLTPGLILLWVIPYSFGHTAAGLLGARSFKFIEELLISPMPDWVVMMGYVVSGMIRGVLVGIIAGIATLLFVQLNIHSVFVSVLVLSLTAFVAALGGFITGLLAKSFDQVTLIQGSILTPLTYLGGVFASVVTLPEWAQMLSLANPMFYMVDGFRFGFLGLSDVPPGTAVTMISLLGILLLLAATKLMSRGSGVRE